MNPDLKRLHPYPFEKLATLKAGITPPDCPHIALSIGEPKHPAPAFVAEALSQTSARLSIYPKTKGLPELSHAVSNWLSRRFQIPSGAVCPERHVLPVNGTREALFSFVQAVVDRSCHQPLVLCPNPFYQIYEGAAILAGAQPWFLNCSQENRYLPDYDQIPTEIWQRCQILFVCSPGNPTGAVTDIDTLKKLIHLADEHDFVIASDECYSELYFDESSPPPGLLQACAELGRLDFRRCVVFHSLSKRSNLPGLRSGFVAGDADILKDYLLYRTYHGCAMSEQVQLASAITWQDEDHVVANRALYQRKFAAVLKELDGCLDTTQPDAGFYLWVKTPGDDCSFARELFAAQNLTVLPGQYLSREQNGVNPGYGHIRIALVATENECLEAARRLRHFCS